MSAAPDEPSSCFNLNFSNPGSTAPFSSLILSSAQTSPSADGMATSDGSKESTPLLAALPDPSNRLLPNGKKTKGRVKIKMEYIGNKLRRYTTFSKRKTGIMKKAHELSTLTGTQVMLLVASETGHVYAFATNKLKPLIAAEPGKSLIQSCLNAPDESNRDATPVRTEFTFEPSNGSLSAANPRKRKIADETLPTMVPVKAESPIEDGDSDGESVDSDTVVPKMDPSLVQKTLEEALRMAKQSRQPKRTKRQNADPLVSLFNQPSLDSFLLPLLLQGASSSASPPPPLLSSPITVNSNSFDDNPPALTTSSSASSSPIVFQLPQGTVYVNELSAANGNASTSASSTAAAPTDAETQQLLGSFAFSGLQQLINHDSKG